MFYDYIREQRSDEYIIWVAIRMYGWHRRLETRQTLVAATRIVCRVVMMMHGALLLYRQVLLHANHSVGVVVMGDNGCHQHDNVDKKQQSYYNSFLPLHPFFLENLFFSGSFFFLQVFSQAFQQVFSQLSCRDFVAET